MEHFLRTSTEGCGQFLRIETCPGTCEAIWPKEILKDQFLGLLVHTNFVRHSTIFGPNFHACQGDAVELALQMGEKAMV